MDEFVLNPIGEETDGGEQETEDLQEDTQNEEGSDDSGTGEGRGVKKSAGGRFLASDRSGYAARREVEEDSGDSDNDPEDAARQEAERARKFNASMKAARQSGEKAGEERANKAHAKRIADMRLPNPEKPGSYFSSVEEMEEYSRNYRRSQAEVRAKREQRSVEEILEEDENRAFLTQQRKAAEASVKSKTHDDQRSTLAAHVAEMRQRYPDVDILKLENNPGFRKFAGSRYGKESLADLYESYTELMGGAEKAAAAKTGSKAARATGGSTGKGGQTLTAAQRAELARWNENNPDMKMTEKEFFERG